VDLLGDVREKSGDEEYPHREGDLEAERRNAKALLLAGLPPSPSPLAGLAFQGEEGKGRGFGIV
jgi:hypothetical protein